MAASYLPAARASSRKRRGCGCHQWDPPSKPMVGVPGALSALWLRLRALDGLLGRDLCDRLFQHTICLFPGLRLKRAHSTALSALDVVPQRQASLVLCAYGSVVLACRSRFVTQAPRLRMPSMGPALKTDGRGAGGTLSSLASPSRARWPAWPRSLRSSLPAHDLPLPWSSLETRQQHRSLGARCSTPTPSLSCALRLWQRRTCLPLALRHATVQAPLDAPPASAKWMPSMGPALKADGRAAGGPLSSLASPSPARWPALPRSSRSSLQARDLLLPKSS